MTLRPSVLHPRSAPAEAVWSLAWSAAFAGVAALVLIALGDVPARALWALGLAAAPGAVDALLPRPAGGSASGGRSWLWAVCAAAAVGLTGGLGGPLSVLVLAPLFAAVAAGGRWREATAPGAAAVAALAIAGGGGALPPPPAPPLLLALGLGATAPALALGAAAVMIWTAGAAPRAEPAPPGEDWSARLAQAEAARVAAEADARGKMRFLANMSHELRTPLNAIIGFSDIMRARLFGELPPRYAEYAELIHESGGHLLDLINDVLDVSKIEADKYVLAREVFDAREAAQGALRLVRQQADDAGVQLRGLLPPEALEVEADRRALKQIVLNLVSNALKFTPQGGSVTVTLAAVGAVLELVVADTGVGIAPEDLERLGRPFEQAGDAADRKRGSGLGLSLVKAFARLHGGDMVLESRLGEGTAATVRLPVLVGAPPLQGEEARGRARPQSDAGDLG